MTSVPFRRCAVLFLVKVAGKEGWVEGKRSLSLSDYLRDTNVKVVRASDIEDRERTVRVPRQGYVWVNDSEDD